MKEDKKVIFIVGPTSAGKTALAIELAKRIDCEIISADSMQAYRYMDIISQKPTTEERKKVPHHLIDILEPAEEYSAAEFVKRAGPLIEGIIERGRMPVVVGGSGLYIKALIDGLFPCPKKDASFRKSIEEEAKRYGSDALHKNLARIDPDAACKIHPNDLRRIIRALEVFYLTGITLSSHKENTKGIKENFNINIYGLTRPKDAIYKRIDRRVDRMFEGGLLSEVRRTMRARPSITAMASLGYKEVSGYLDGLYPLEEAKELLKKNTRHFAKRQLAWFKPDNRIMWIDLEETPQEEALMLILKDIGWKRLSPSLSLQRR